MGGPCPHGARVPLAASGLRLSCPLLLCEHLPWRWAIPIPTGRALAVGHALGPLPCATLGAGMPRGMVHRDQGGR